MIAFLLFILLQVADSWTTLTALKMNGREMNPLLNYVFRMIGPVQGLILMKSLSIIIIGLLVFDHWIVWVLNGIYTIVVLHNIKQIKG